MKVAIIGAGTAGLACALELKRHGIVPHIYEKRPEVGHPLEHTITNYNLFNPSQSIPLGRMKKKFGLYLQPLYSLKKTIIKGPSKTTTMRGNLGVVFKRGVESYSLEKQLYAMVDAPIEYNTYVDIKKIRDDYDSIVVATGDESIAKQLGLWNSLLSMYVRVATVIGDFTPGTMNLWIDANSAKSMYTYLLPNTPKEASLVFHINDSRGDEMEYFWKEFLFTQEIQYKIIETREGEYDIGYATSFSTPDHIYFVGGAGGFTEDVYGFEALESIYSGIYAAQSIACGKDYEKLLRNEIKSMKQTKEYVRTFAAFDSETMDKFAAFITMPAVKRMIYSNPLSKA